MSATRNPRWHATAQARKGAPLINAVKPIRLFTLTLLAMIAFASNSLLCRAALKQTNIDAASFTFIRIFSGAAMLWIILEFRTRRMVERTASPLVERREAEFPSPQSSPKGRGGPFSLREKVGMRAAGSWLSALALFAYAAAFSFAYNTLPAGTGALLLFGAVQATMILWGLHTGERLHAIQIIGLVIALIGLVILVFPGLSAPPLIGSILMLSAGVAWGIYSLRGKAARDAIAATAGNFLRAVPFALVVSIILIPWARFDRTGVIYAVISGALTSGLGYVLWYRALPGLRAASAATVQLSVPVLAATGGILLLSEPITLRYFVASITILGGIALVVLSRFQRGDISNV
jgi:drug/metabolite transporter (DMT)-like permease